MQRTIRVLRVALPIVFFGFVLIIAFSWRHGKPHKDKSTTQPVTSTMRPADKPKGESKKFEDTQTVAGRVAMHIVAERVISYVSGWNTLENVHLTIYRPTGLTYELVCPQAQFNSDTKEADAKGGVRVTSSDNVEIITAEIHYDGNHLTNHIPVSFKVDRWIGNAGALDLDVPGESLRLFERVDANMAPADPGEAPMNVKTVEAIFRRQQNTVDFDREVIVTREVERMNADHVVGRFTPDRKALTSLEGFGKITIVAGASTPMMASSGGRPEAAGRKEITCDHFWTDLGPTGQIAAINAAGTPAHAVLEGSPTRDLVALTFKVRIDNKTVSEMQAHGGVVMKEPPPTARQMNADHLTVMFDPRTHQAASAVAEGSFKYKDPRNEASAVRAHYDIGNDKVVLSAEPGYDPTVVTDGETLKAKLIEFSPRAGTAKATGSVIAQLVGKPSGPSADATTLFPAARPVYINSDVVTIRQANKSAIFNGNVRAWQETNALFADEMQVQGAGDSITARGNVRTFLYNTSSNFAAEARKTPMKSRSEQLIARKTDRRIDLSGSVQIDDEQRHLASERASLFFDPNKRVERVEAEGKVVLTEEPTQRKAAGDKATYLVTKRLVYIYGSPATVTAPNETISGLQISIDLARNKVEVISPSGTHKQ